MSSASGAYYLVSLEIPLFQVSLFLTKIRLEDTAYGASSHLPFKTMKAENASVWNRFIMYLDLNHRFHVKFPTESSVQGAETVKPPTVMVVFQVVPSIYPVFQA